MELNMSEYAFDTPAVRQSLSFQSDEETLVHFCPFENAQKIVFEIIIGSKKYGVRF